MLRYAITDGTFPEPVALGIAHGMEQSGVCLLDASLSPASHALFHQANRLAQQGVDFLQLREKHLSTVSLVALATALLRLLDGSPTRLLVNAGFPGTTPGPEGTDRPSPDEEIPTAAIASVGADKRAAVVSETSIGLLSVPIGVDAACISRAHGVHLPASSAFGPALVRSRFGAAGLPVPIVSIACHTLEQVRDTHGDPPDLILFSPVFGKVVDGVLVTPAAGLTALAEACSLAAPVPVLALGGVTFANAPGCLEAGASGTAGIRLFQS